MALIAGCAAQTGGEPPATPAGGGSAMASPLPTPSPRAYVRETGPASPDLGAAERQFARDYLSVLPYRRENAVWSPWGLYQVTAMAALGARGTTAEELAKVLHAERSRLKSGLRDTRDRLRTTGVEWVDEARLFHRPQVQVEPEFPRLLQTTFGAGIAPFDSVDPVNAWIEGVTKGRLPGALAPTDLDARDAVVLVDAFYLNAPWEVPFPKEDTRPLPFRSPGEERAVPTMTGLRSMGIAARQGYRMAEFPYEGGRLVLDVLLPDEEDGLEALERSLRRGELQTAFAALRQERVDVQLPRFSFLSREEALPQLERLGLPTRGDYSGVTSTRTAMRSVLAITGIRVHEEGTEAAGAVPMGMGSPAGTSVEPPPPVPFHVDHPALFLVRDLDTGVILLMGRLVRPVEGWP